MIDTIADEAMARHLHVRRHLPRRLPEPGKVPGSATPYSRRTVPLPSTPCRSVRLFLIEPRLIDDGVGHYLALNNRRVRARRPSSEIDELSNQSLSYSSCSVAPAARRCRRPGRTGSACARPARGSFSAGWVRRRAGG
ncbi:hypothetical protein ACPA9J_08250 [Pseudomonas aeruginosa]